MSILFDKSSLPISIPRPTYIERVSPFIGKGLIKVLTGQRRVGESHILYQLMDEIIRREARTEILYVNKEFHEFHDLRDGDELYEYVSAYRSRRTAFTSA